GTTDATNNVNENDTNNTTDTGDNTVTDGTTGNVTDNNANVADNGNNTTDNNGTKDVTSPDGTNNNTTGNKTDTLISEKEASEIALSHIKGADTSHLNIHQETEDGRTIYEGTITYNDREHHFEIDANSGEILEWDMELLTR
ncbi:MAG: PepSY domain-containing protein, partial [Eubacterium sp.]|nr:PepSY domain-containing protein [Eubacterium sp.]